MELKNTSIKMMKTKQIATPRLHFKFEPGQVARDTYTAVDTNTNSLISAVIVSDD